VPPIGPDELPPPYSPTSPGSIPTINCKVCQSLINIEGKTNQHVIKCSVCNEATVRILGVVIFIPLNIFKNRNSFVYIRLLYLWQIQLSIYNASIPLFEYMHYANKVSDFLEKLFSFK